MNKKVFAVLLAVVMLLGMIVVPAAAKAEGEEPEKEIVILYTTMCIAASPTVWAMSALPA